jgi:BirA family biotin operon repressor/biotin-[acetyl-CoA-carboxylase] ligase
MLRETVFQFFDTIDSTNTYARREVATFDLSKLTVIVADEQTAGRGRFRRHWLSPRGQNLYASFVFSVPFGFHFLPNLSQCLICGIVDVLRANDFSPRIKWPNDLLLDGKKAGGILTETVPLADSIGIVAGIGLNLNMDKALLASIDQPATSLEQVSGKPWSRDILLPQIVEKVVHSLDLLEREGFAPFCTTINECLAFKGQEIVLHDAHRTWRGLCHGVDPSGHLQLLLPSGQVVSLPSGDVSSHIS